MFAKLFALNECSWDNLSRPQNAIPEIVCKAKYLNKINGVLFWPRKNKIALLLIRFLPDKTQTEVGKCKQSDSKTWNCMYKNRVFDLLTPTCRNTHQMRKRNQELKKNENLHGNYITALALSCSKHKIKQYADTRKI